MIHALLTDPEQVHSLACDIRYVLVDKYQDTNYVQEQLLLKLTERTRNLCVVGDEDQSLYHFGGATVRNILEFLTRFPDCTVVKLTTNYRSHKSITQKYDRWMASADWSNPRGVPFRYDKQIAADLDSEHPNYPAAFCIWGQDERDEASRFADLVHFLKASGVIEDYQAKGLEFPGVVVGSLSTQLSNTKQIDRDLSPFYHRNPFEPQGWITLFDRMRLHYVAFSRPQKVLVLTAHESPKDHFAPIWQGLPQWPYVQQDLVAAQRFQLRERMSVKRAYSFTGDLKIYETCPRQYQFFRRNQGSAKSATCARCATTRASSPGASENRWEGRGV